MESQEKINRNKRNLFLTWSFDKRLSFSGILHKLKLLKRAGIGNGGVGKL